MDLRNAVLGAGMRTRLEHRVDRLDLPAPEPEGPPVTEADLAALPEPARRWLRRAGVVGRPRDLTLDARWRGRFRLRPRARWMPFEAWQHNTVGPVSRVYTMRIDMAGVLPMFGVDSYVRGTGRMHGRVLGLVPVADGAGPEFDAGELATWLDDAVLLAPSMLLVPAVTVEPVADDAFAVTVADGGRRVSVTVRVETCGRVRDVTTDDRWCALPSGPVRARWTTPVDGWVSVDGRQVPLYARAVWDLPEGRWTYAWGRLDPLAVRWNGRTGPRPLQEGAEA
jgi:hypothetical protein